MFKTQPAAACVEVRRLHVKSLQTFTQQCNVPPISPG